MLLQCPLHFCIAVFRSTLNSERTSLTSTCGFWSCNTNCWLISHKYIVDFGIRTTIVIGVSESKAMRTFSIQVSTLTKRCEHRRTRYNNSGACTCPNTCSIGWFCVGCIDASLQIQRSTTCTNCCWP